MVIYLKFYIITLNVYFRNGSFWISPSFKKFLFARFEPVTLLNSFLSYALIIRSCLTLLNYLILSNWFYDYLVFLLPDNDIGDPLLLPLEPKLLLGFDR